MPGKSVRWFANAEEALRHSLQDYVSGLQYSMASEDAADGAADQVMPFAFCREYLTDIVYSGLHNQPVNSYGLVIPAPPRPATTRTRLLLSNPKEPADVFLARAVNAVDFVAHYEGLMDLPPSELVPCDSPPPKTGAVVMFDGSNLWQSSPPMLSLYSLLIRIGMVHRSDERTPEDTMRLVVSKTVKSYQVNDAEQARFALRVIDWLAGKPGFRTLLGTSQAKNFPNRLTVDDLHTRSGVVSYSHGTTARYYPEWEDRLKAAGIAR